MNARLAVARPVPALGMDDKVSQAGTGLATGFFNTSASKLLGQYSRSVFLPGSGMG